MPRNQTQSHPAPGRRNTPLPTRDAPYYTSTCSDMIAGKAAAAIYSLSDHAVREAASPPEVTAHTSYHVVLRTETHWQDLHFTRRPANHTSELWSPSPFHAVQGPYVLPSHASLKKLISVATRRPPSLHPADVRAPRHKAPPAPITEQVSRHTQKPHGHTKTTCDLWCILMAEIYAHFNGELVREGPSHPSPSC